MRVIAGKARRLQLKTLPGDHTRPTTDRIKETLFNILSFGVEGSRFLDLFAGSGAIGIEAISRGADQAVFVENNRQALSCIRENLAHTKLEKEAVVLGREVQSAISQLDLQKNPFDYIFMDPPYGKQLEKDVLFSLKEHPSLLHEDTLIIVESDLKTDFPYMEELPFFIDREKIYKTNKHTFFRVKKDES